jgi:hypothetical protein
MKNYIVTVALRGLDVHGIEAGDINTVYVPTRANNEAEAVQAAVVYHSDSGVASENERLEIECKEPKRGFVWIATKVLSVTSEEMNTFLSLTQGVHRHTICQSQG